MLEMGKELVRGGTTGTCEATEELSKELDRSKTIGSGRIGTGGCTGEHGRDREVVRGGTVGLRGRETECRNETFCTIEVGRNNEEVRGGTGIGLGVVILGGREGNEML